MIAALINLIVYLLIVGILLALVYWVIDVIPLPEPINRIAKVVIVVISAMIVILLLLQLLGVGGSGGVALPKLVE
jgi:hypothetical protein